MEVIALQIVEPGNEPGFMLQPMDHHPAIASEYSHFLELEWGCIEPVSPGVPRKLSGGGSKKCSKLRTKSGFFTALPQSDQAKQLMVNILREKIHRHGRAICLATAQAQAA